MVVSDLLTANTWRCIRPDNINLDDHQWELFNGEYWLDKIFNQIFFK